MAELTTKARNKLKATSFALPGRRYPVNDLPRARNALARVNQHGTPEEKRAVYKKVFNRFPSLRVGMKETHPELLARSKKAISKTK